MGHHRHGASQFGGPWNGPWSGGVAGPPPWVAQMFGEGALGRRGPRGRGGPRVRRGDVRSAILDVLAGSGEGDGLNGYQVIQQIGAKSGEVWRPSPGSVYPTIAQLEDEGLVETVAEGGKKTLRLTEAGRAYAADHADELDAVWEPFADAEGDGEHANLKQVIGQTMAAVWQIATTGTADQHERAIEILADTRRRLYGVLADGPEEDTP